MSNTWAIYPRAWDNTAKAVLIPDVAVIAHAITVKGGLLAMLPREDEPAAH